jgi:serine/threonine protein kinase
MSLAAGIGLGPYEVLSAISAGGMGEVYKARDTRLNRFPHSRGRPHSRGQVEEIAVVPAVGR